MSKGSKRNKARSRPPPTRSSSTGGNSGGGVQGGTDFSSSPPIPPDLAAQFFSQMAAAAKAKKAQQQQQGASGSGSGGVQYGPSRPPQTSGTTTSTSISFGSLDGFAAFAKSKTKKGDGSSSSFSGPGNGEPPSFSGITGGVNCAEKDFKTLMGVFAEIMGMSVEESMMMAAASTGTSLSGSPPSSSKSTRGKGGGSGGSNGPVFMFGKGGSADGVPDRSGSLATGSLPPGAMAAAARAASLACENGSFAFDYYDDEDDDEDDYEYDYEDEEDDDDSIPDLEDSKPSARYSVSSMNGSSVSSRPPIRDEDWESLEQVAAEDDAEAAERERKAAKKREKKQRKRERARKEAAEKAALAAQKKRDKAIQGWRSRVIQACQSNEATKLETLISESPLKRDKQNPEEVNFEAFVASQVEFLIPSCMAKTSDQVGAGQEAKQMLTRYVVKMSVATLFVNGRSGRNALHSAGMVGDYLFCQWVVTAVKKDHLYQKQEWLDRTCSDSGWAALHYAVVVGSKEVIEVLLASGANVTIRTNKASTCNPSSGQGVTPRELAEWILLGKPDNALDYNGSALDDILKDTLDHGVQRRSYHESLREVIQRLSEVEERGYTPSDDFPAVAALFDVSEEASKTPATTIRSAAETTKKKRRKKKKNQQQQAQAQNPPPEPIADADNSPPEDPMITALLGMGFSREQIDSAAKACGGTNRATADDLVMWIFEQQAGGTSRSEPVNDAIEQAPDDNDGFQLVDEGTEAKKKAAAREESERQRKEEEARLVAERLAAKKEEQRRRNREWNNREQARQRQAQQAKLQKAVELRAKADAFQAARTGRGYHPHPAPPITSGTASMYPPPTGGPPIPTTIQKSVVPKTILQPPRNAGLVGGVPGLNGIHPSNKQKPSSRKAQQKQHAAKLLSADDMPSFHSDSVATTHVNGSKIPEEEEDSSVITGISASSSIPGSAQPPPGFTPPSLGPSGMESAAPSLVGYQPDPNPTGEIRATAKAFVPQRFTPPPSQQVTPAPKPAPTVQVPVNQDSLLLPVQSGNASFEEKPTPPSLPPDLGAADASILSSMLSGPPPGSSGHVKFFERSNMVTPSTTHSATSSVTGISTTTTMEDGGATSLPPGISLSLDPPGSGLGVFDTQSTSVLGSMTGTSNPAPLGPETIVPGAALWLSSSINAQQEAPPAPVVGLNFGVAGSGAGSDDNNAFMNGSWSASGMNQTGSANAGTTNGLGSIW